MMLNKYLRNIKINELGLESQLKTVCVMFKEHFNQQIKKFQSIN